MNEKCSIENNSMLDFTTKIRSLTYGMCRVGPGPHGFGVCNTNPANIGMLIIATPSPFGDIDLSPEDDMINVSVEGYFKIDITTQSSGDSVQQLRIFSDPSTQVIANALVELSKTPIVVSKADFFSAFDYLLEQDMQGTIGLSGEEARKLAESGWYEAKTAEEIVDYQRYEPLPCMSIDKFRQALETVLDRSVMSHELASKSRRQAEYQGIKQRPALTVVDGDTQTEAGMEMGGF